MKLDILLSCMHQQDASLVHASGIVGNAVVINQCDREDYLEESTATGRVRMIFTCQRGLTKSRNLAIRSSDADVCLLCDDDEKFVADYERKILEAYRDLPQADVIIFKMVGRSASFPDRVMELRFPKTMHVSSWQISFRRQRLMDVGVQFDELLGAGSGNGAEEELKFLTDCEKANLAIYYVPAEIASVAQAESTWFGGFTETFFENRGATTRYVLGAGLASLYAVYYIVRKRGLYGKDISPSKALRATFRGIRENKISKQAKQQRF